jgi:N-methylhydantoinase A
MEFAERSGVPAEPQLEFVAEARYRHQVWQLDVPLRGGLGSAEELAQLVEDFHAVHEEVYAVRDERAVIEVVNLRARVTCPLAGGVADAITVEETAGLPARRRVFFSDVGTVDAQIVRLEALSPGTELAGPAIIESSFTTIVLNPDASAQRSSSGSLVISPQDARMVAAAGKSSTGGEFSDGD